MASGAGLGIGDGVHDLCLGPSVGSDGEDQQVEWTDVNRGVGRILEETCIEEEDDRISRDSIGPGCRGTDYLVSYSSGADWSKG